VKKRIFLALNRTVVLRAKFRPKIGKICQNRTGWQVCSSNPIAKTLYFHGAAIYRLFTQAYTDRYLSAYSNEKYFKRRRAIHVIHTERAKMRWAVQILLHQIEMVKKLHHAMICDPTP
jgi:hypothetical protein